MEATLSLVKKLERTATRRRQSDPDLAAVELVLPLDAPVGERSLNRLTYEQLRGLERELDKQPPRQKRRTVRPRPSMGKAG